MNIEVVRGPPSLVYADYPFGRSYLEWVFAKEIQTLFDPFLTESVLGVHRIHFRSDVLIVTTDMPDIIGQHLALSFTPHYKGLVQGF